MQQLGEYLIHQLIGEGGMGKVYEAEERLSRRRVALKVLRDDLAQSDDGRRMFLREMTILSRLDHPNVVRCLACTEAGGHLVMVLEHLQGQTLREVLRQQSRLSWQQAVGIAASIASGLGAAHEHEPPIVHRDLKPENVMILTDGRTKVMDFGIAKMIDAIGSQTAYTVGTLQYMSPEQIEGHVADPRADLYCLGLVLYEMLSGRPPFASESPRELLNLHCTQAPPRFTQEVSATLPPGLESLVFELLTKDPGERPATAQIVRGRLDALLRTQDAAAGVPAGVPMQPYAPLSAAQPTSPLTSHPSSMGTIMLVERAGTAQQRGRTLRLVAGIVAAVGVIGATSAWLVYGQRGRVAADAEDVGVAEASEPEPETRPVEKAAAAEPDDARADEVRERARRERAAADDGGPPPEDAKPPEDVKPPEEQGTPDEGGLLRSFGLVDEEPPEDDGFFGRLGRSTADETP